MTTHLEPPLQRVVERLRSSRRVLFVTGAGLSADSGLPTYRGVGGLYDDSATEDGLPIETALSGPMLEDRPDLTWKYISGIEAACRGAQPNRGHEVIAELERTHEVLVLTQNVDGFHKRAGSQRVIDIHGDVHELLCSRCETQQVVSDYSALDIPPYCYACGGLIRPNVVLFGEMLPTNKVLHLQAELERGFEVVFSIGTSALFEYIATPIAALRERGALTVEINPSPTAVSEVVDIIVRERAAPTLNRILAAMFPN